MCRGSKKVKRRIPNYRQANRKQLDRNMRTEATCGRGFSRDGGFYGDGKTYRQQRLVSWFTGTQMCEVHYGGFGQSRNQVTFPPSIVACIAGTVLRSAFVLLVESAAGGGCSSRKGEAAHVHSSGQAGSETEHMHCTRYEHRLPGDLPVAEGVVVIERPADNQVRYAVAYRRVTI